MNTFCILPFCPFSVSCYLCLRVLVFCSCSLMFIFTSNPSFVLCFLLSFFLLHLLFLLSLPSRSSRTAWTPMCPETGCCGIPYLVVSMHSPSTQRTLPSSLFTMPYWVSVDLVKLGSLICLDAVVIGRFTYKLLAEHHFVEAIKVI